MTLDELEVAVEAKCDMGERVTGCSASVWDRAFYAAQILFPMATDDDQRLIADYVAQND